MLDITTNINRGGEASVSEAKPHRLCSTLKNLREDAVKKYINEGMLFFNLPLSARLFYEIELNYWISMGGKL